MGVDVSKDTGSASDEASTSIVSMLKSSVWVKATAEKRPILMIILDCMSAVGRSWSGECEELLRRVRKAVKERMREEMKTKKMSKPNTQEKIIMSCKVRLKRLRGRWIALAG